MAVPYPDAVVTTKAFFDPTNGGVQSLAINSSGLGFVNSSTNTYRGVINGVSKTCTWYNISPYYLGLFQHYTKDNYLITYHPYSGSYFYKMNSSGTYLAQSLPLSGYGYGLNTTMSYSNNVCEDANNPYIYIKAAKTGYPGTFALCRLDYSDMSMTFQEHLGSGGPNPGFYATADDKFWLCKDVSSTTEFNLTLGQTGKGFALGTGILEDQFLENGKGWIADRGPTDYLWVFNTTTAANLSKIQRDGAKVLATNGKHIFLLCVKLTTPWDASVLVIDRDDYSLLQTITGLHTDVGGTYRFWYLKYNPINDQLIAVSNASYANNNASFVDLNSATPNAQALIHG